METKIFNRRVKFKVGLSNGETHYEGKAPYELIKGELAPWHRLQIYLKEKNLTITSLSLYTDKGQTFNLPSAGNNPKFKAFQFLEKPIELNYKRIFERDLEPNAVGEVLVCIEAVYSSYILKLFVSESNPDNCWVLVI